MIGKSSTWKFISDALNKMFLLCLRRISKEIYAEIWTKLFLLKWRPLISAEAETKCFEEFLFAAATFKRSLRLLWVSETSCKAPIAATSTSFVKELELKDEYFHKRSLCVEITLHSGYNLHCSTLYLLELWHQLYQQKTLECNPK